MDPQTEQNIRSLSDEKLKKLLCEKNELLPRAIEIAEDEGRNRGFSPEELSGPGPDLSQAKRSYFDLYFTGLTDAFRNFLPGNFVYFFITSIAVIAGSVIFAFFQEEYTGVFTTRLNNNMAPADAYIYLFEMSVIGAMAVFFYKKYRQVAGPVGSAAEFFRGVALSGTSVVFFALIAGIPLLWLSLNSVQFLAGTGDYPLDPDSIVFIPRSYFFNDNPLLFYLLTELFQWISLILLMLIPAMATQGAFLKTFSLKHVFSQKLPWGKILLTMLIAHMLLRGIEYSLVSQTTGILLILSNYESISIGAGIILLSLAYALLLPLKMALLVEPFRAAGLEVPESEPDDEEELFSPVA